MNKKPFYIRLLSVAIVLLFVGTLFIRCASVGSPTGGPRDSLPPVVLGVMPEFYSTEFDDDKIYITFNEYVQIRDQQKELYTSPAMRKKPRLLLRGKTLVVEMERDSLDDNTTYAIEFGSTVVDNNEGNPLHGLRYVFSTGKSIDSMLMSGYTEDSQKGDSLGRAFICFFEADSVDVPQDYDSTMFKYKPSKIARSQKNGIFIAQNLKPVDYRVYAFWDSNDNQTYEPSIDKIGFLDDVYNPAQMSEFAIWYDSLRHYTSAEPQLYFRMFQDVSFARQSLQESKRLDRHQLELQFSAANPDIRSLTIDEVPSDRIIIEPLTRGRDTLALWLSVPSESLPDTLHAHITYMKHDSVRMLREHSEDLNLAWRLVESREQEKEREKLQKEREKAEAEGREWVEPYRPSTFQFVNLRKDIEVNPEEDLQLEFATPLTHFDSTAFSLISYGEKRDTIVEKLRFIPDSVSPRKWRLQSNWDSKRRYRLHIPTDALADITGEGNDSLDMNITVSDIDKYATLVLNVRPREAGDEYIFQITDSHGKTLREIRNVGEGVHTLNYIPVGDLKMRIIEDKNRNGRWDGGNMVERRQSERAEYYKNENEEELFTTKTGWEFEFSIDMGQLFAPITMQQLNERLDKREMQRLIKLEEERRKARESGKKQNNRNSGGLGGAMGGMGGMSGMLGGLR
ncbi:MAG: Ig-like domain-containing protein [Alistipes sp.]|nr:Ig-like domain-containing protein [Alistipes sp.]